MDTRCWTAAYLEDPAKRRQAPTGDARTFVRLYLRRLDHAVIPAGVLEGIDLYISPGDLDSDEALDTWIVENLTTAIHMSGTCKMGPASDPMAVVDQHCRVHGLKGLRVVDTSIMPDVVRANTNATAIMIGERAADWFK